MPLIKELSASGDIVHEADYVYEADPDSFEGLITTPTEFERNLERIEDEERGRVYQDYADMVLVDVEPEGFDKQKEAEEWLERLYAEEDEDKREAMIDELRERDPELFEVTRLWPEIRFELARITWEARDKMWKQIDAVEGRRRDRERRANAPIHARNKVAFDDFMAHYFDPVDAEGVVIETRTRIIEKELLYPKDILDISIPSHLPDGLPERREKAALVETKRFLDELDIYLAVIEYENWKHKVKFDRLKYKESEISRVKRLIGIAWERFENLL